MVASGVDEYLLASHIFQLGLAGLVPEVLTRDITVIMAVACLPPWFLSTHS